jgi:hypothetical protein
MPGMFEMLDTGEVQEALRLALPGIIQQYKLQPDDLDTVIAMTIAMVKTQKTVGICADAGRATRRAKASAALVIAVFEACERSMENHR